ncbi:alpha/beta hydrolase [Flavobacterium rhizosphaerae]|uniref:Alpha/beta hydrolase n=1 Tax=Flavobacterium rhizosphaerae TaxID=3163298 RepID=A0ABW8YX14_9FLAO
MSSSKQSPVSIPKSIKTASVILEALSPKLAAKFAIKLFMTPIKYKLPKREENMDKNTQQEHITITPLNKTICVYHYGTGARKVLLVHGWSGRGTQLHSIADKLIKAGYSTISFDAPAHGKSEGKTSDMTEFIGCILQLQQQYGPFEFAIGHSLGAMAVLNAVRKGLSVKKIVTIGSGDIIDDIITAFTGKLGMKIATTNKVRQQFQKKFNEPLNEYSAYMAVKQVNIPVLVLHDEDDHDVPVSAAHNIYSNLADAELYITQGLGHRKILGDKAVINKITAFLEI